MGVRYLGLGNAILDTYARQADDLSCWVYETWNANPTIWSIYDMVNILWDSLDLDYWLRDWLRQRETFSLQSHMRSQRLQRRMIRLGLKQKLPLMLIDYVTLEFVGPLANWQS